jgi:hypothetical protein
LVCNPALGVKNLNELIAKSKTQSLSYASGGAGVPGHLSMELLLNMTGMQMVHIPYKGPAPAAQDCQPSTLWFVGGPHCLATCALWQVDCFGGIGVIKITNTA